MLPFKVYKRILDKKLNKLLKLNMIKRKEKVNSKKKKPTWSLLSTLYIKVSSNLSLTMTCIRNICFLKLKIPWAYPKPTYIRPLALGPSCPGNSEVQSSLRTTAFLSGTQMGGKLRVVSRCLSFIKTSSLYILY